MSLETFGWIQDAQQKYFELINAENNPQVGQARKSISQFDLELWESVCGPARTTVTSLVLIVLTWLLFMVVVIVSALD